MKIIRRTIAHFSPRLILRWLAVFCVCGLSLAAQSPSALPGGTTAPSTNDAAPPVIHGVIRLDGPWRFQEGDDPRWSDPAFDDTNWSTVLLSEPLTDQGFEPYSGYAWYRLRLGPQQLAAFVAGATPLELHITGDSLGQISVFVNNLEMAHTKGMTEPPKEYLSPPLVADLPAPDRAGARVLAIRTWAGPTTTIRRGLLTKVEVGTQPEVAERVAAASGGQWNEHATAAIFLALLFACVALFGGALYVAQRHHSEYLWLAILCAVAAAARLERAAFGLALISLPAYWTLGEFTAYIFVAVTLEFVFRFTGSELRRVVRGVQVAVLIAPFVHFVRLQSLEQAVSLSGEAAFCVVVTGLLYKAWRRGRGDAGTMLLPFFLASSIDLIETALNFAVGRHWLPEQFAPRTFYFGPIAYDVGNITDVIFLSSLIAVILFRFIRVSQDEQRANAEIAAARSVQALLIPTQLPSNKNFMLESAYLPVNGVGGDFFQVLPLKDDSLLIVVGDVSGKGLQAAMNSSTLVGALRNELSHDPATILDHLNRVLLGAVSTPGAVPGLDSAPCFATCLCARIYPNGTLTIANAGHLSPYRDGRELELTPNLPLGVIADSHYEQTTFQLNRGDRLVFLSDGVVEATNAHGELFGFERTQQVSHESARYIAQTARHFGQADDITVVSLYLASRSAERTGEETAYSM